MKLWKIEHVGAIVVARYNNPPKNYFTSEAVSEFKALVELWQDPAIRAVILTGATPGFFITHYSVEELHAVACDQELLVAREKRCRPQECVGFGGFEVIGFARFWANRAKSL